MRRYIKPSVETVAVSICPKIASQFYCSQVSTGTQSIIDIVLLVYNLSARKTTVTSKKLDEHLQNQQRKEIPK